MTFHPRERRLPRRQFIKLTAYGAAAAGFGPSLLAACGGSDDAGAPKGASRSPVRMRPPPCRASTRSSRSPTA